MCLTCDKRPEFASDEDAIKHMKSNPFHQVVYYDDRSIDSALDKVKEKLAESDM
jgi:hypothetical protein